jgi:hypothetical protein
MSTSEFASPAPSGGGIEYHDLDGSLLVIDVHEIAKDVTTVHGIKDAARVTITVIDGNQAGDTYPDTLIFPKVLLAQLRANVGKKVLGRLGVGEKKSGQKPPWKLAEATPDDIAAATKFLAATQTVTLTEADI